MQSIGVELIPKLGSRHTRSASKAGKGGKRGEMEIFLVMCHLCSSDPGFPKCSTW